MAILDGKLELMDAQSITMIPHSWGSTVSVESDILDLGTGFKDEWDQSITPNIGEGGGLWLNVRASTAITTSATCTLDLYTHTATDVINGTCLLSKLIAANLGTGQALLRVKVPANTIQRYLQIFVSSSWVTIAAGALDAWIGLDSETSCPVT